MAVLDDAELKAVVKTAGQIYYTSRLKKLSEDLKIIEVIKTVNPYRQEFDGVTGEQLAKAIVDSHINASNEGMFGNVMEHIAIYIVTVLHSGYKLPEGTGFDFQWKTGSTTNFAQFKSGWDWNNKDSLETFVHNVSKMKIQQPKARFYNLIARGDSKQEKKQGYIKMAGKDTWSLLTGDSKFYLKLTELIVPDMKMVAEINAQKDKVILSVIERLEKIGIIKTDGTINWRRLVDYTS